MPKRQLPEDLAPILPAFTEPRYSPDSKYFYELMSGGLVWEDEQMDFPVEQSNFIRMVWAFRTALILGESRPELLPFWETAKSMAPDWIGFRADRCSPSKEIVDYLLKAKRRFERNLERYDKAESGERKPLTGKI